VKNCQRKFEEAYLAILSGLEASRKINNKNLTGFGYQYLSEHNKVTINCNQTLNIFLIC
jgi:hypothetical protein